MTKEAIDKALEPFIGRPITKKLAKEIGDAIVKAAEEEATGDR